ncbi:hypothetical protein B0T25DRAFT_597860, partial [Lasiosphaeria hispida]
KQDVKSKTKRTSSQRRTGRQVKDEDVKSKTKTSSQRSRMSSQRRTGCQVKDERDVKSDEAGRQVKDDRTSSLNEAGRQVNEAGRQVNEAGRQVNEAGRQVNEAGRQVKDEQDVKVSKTKSRTSGLKDDSQCSQGRQDRQRQGVPGGQRRQRQGVPGGQRWQRQGVPGGQRLVSGACGVGEFASRSMRCRRICFQEHAVSANLLPGGACIGEFPLWRSAWGVGEFPLPGRACLHSADMRDMHISGFQSEWTSQADRV